jgi:hypothetical protein
MNIVLKMCPLSFDQAHDAFNRRNFCHPGRQAFFFQCFFNHKKDIFKNAVLKYAVNEKDSRKQRIRYKNQDQFIQTVDPLTKEEIKEISTAVEILFDQNPFDDFFVEKTYSLLEGIMDYLKINGTLCIKKYIKENNPNFLKDPNFTGHLYIKWFTEDIQAESFDTRLIEFNNDKNKEHVINYCKQYRSSELVKQWIKENKSEIKKSFERK